MRSPAELRGRDVKLLRREITSGRYYDLDRMGVEWMEAAQHIAPPWG